LTERSDAELLEAVRGGDASALEALLRRHQDRIFRFGMRMCRDREDAREVLQDTMLAVARSAERFRGDSSFASWLFAIARNACAKHRRKSADEPESLEPLDAALRLAATHGPEHELERRRLERALEDAIAALEPSYREVVLLRDVEGLSAKEVATATGLSVAAVKSRLHRARVELRARLQPQLANEPAEPRPDTCPDVLQALSEHTEGDLEPSACRTLEEHVASCPHCAARCDALREVLAACATLPPGPVPTAIAAAVRDALKSAG
jgi:RNA polymerase sigma-70 factor (ECF subfamily)